MLYKMDNQRSWIIAIACSWIAFCNTGIYRSSSVLYVEMINTLALTRESASWPFSLFGAVSSFTGILPGLLSERLEVKHFVTIGASLSTFGVLACSLGVDIAWITVAFGIIAGFGSGLIMTLLPVVINANFKSNRATANGIFLSGSTVSLLVLPSLTEWLVHHYALKGTFLLLSGLVLNVLVGAMFLKHPKKENSLMEKREVAKEIDNLDQEANPKAINRFPQLKPELLNYRITEANTEINDKFQTEKFGIEKPIMELFTINETEKENLRVQINEFTKPEMRAYDEPEERDTRKLEQSKCQYLYDKVADNSRVDSDEQKCFQIKELKRKERQHDGRENWSNTMLKCGRTLFDPMFILITFSSVTTRTVIVTVSLILVDYVMDKGETEIEGVILVSVVAIPELVGRLGSGWISDHKFLKRTHVFLISEVLSGVCLFLLTIVNAPVLIFTLCTLFFFSNGGAFILVNVFYLEYLGLDRLPVALGLKNLFTGLASLTRPWFIGVFRDQVCSYDNLFQTLGAISVLAGAVWLLEPLMTSKNSNKNNSEVECS